MRLFRPCPSDDGWRADRENDAGVSAISACRTFSSRSSSSVWPDSDLGSGGIHVEPRLAIAEARLATAIIPRRLAAEILTQCGILRVVRQTNANCSLGHASVETIWGNDSGQPNPGVELDLGRGQALVISDDMVVDLPHSRRELEQSFTIRDWDSRSSKWIP